MNNNFFSLEYIFVTSIAIALSCTGCMYGIAYYFSYDSFSINEVAFFPIISLFLVFILSSLILFTSIKKYRNNTTSKHIANSYYILATVALTSILIFLIDVFMHAMIDDTLSLKYAETLQIVSKQYAVSSKNINNISKIPFILQNVMMTCIGLISGSFFSLFILSQYKKMKSNLQTI